MKYEITQEDIKTALKKNKIIPYFQPIVNKNKQIIKYEALIRMIDKFDNVINPFCFLPVAKKDYKLYSEISKIVINKVSHIIDEKKLNISINLSHIDLIDNEIIKLIKEKPSHIKKRLTIEILEDEDLRESRELNSIIKELKQDGIEFFVDDFGSRYANFEYLLNLDINGIKIDGYYIKKINFCNKTLVVIKHIINLAKELNLKIVAEFIEHEGTFKRLKKMGIDYFQGYYFSPPIYKI